VTVLDLLLRWAEEVEAGSVDEGGVVPEAGVCVFNFRKDSAPLETPANTLTVEQVVLVGMVEALVEVTVDEDEEGDMAVEHKERVVMVVRSGEVEATEEQLLRRGILPMAVRLVALMINREAVVMDSRQPHKVTYSKEVQGLTGSFREVPRAVMYNREHLLQEDIPSRVEEHPVGITVTKEA